MSIDYSERSARLLGILEIGEQEGFVISHLPDVRWLTGFSGSSGLVLLSRSGTILITDGRYSEQVKTECPGLEVLIRPGAPGNHLGPLLEHKRLRTLRIQAPKMSWAQVKSWQEAWSDIVIVPAGEELESLRIVKSEPELALIQRALEITEQVFGEVISSLEEGISENDVAAEIDYLQRNKGASGSAFDTIVAFSENAALPHARPGSRQLKRGDSILMDFGCVVQGYHSDMTRTVSFGQANKQFLDAYEAVHSALRHAQDGAIAGITGASLDGLARDRLTSHGFGNAFNHSLGHGVGLEIHESPSVSIRNQHSLVAGSIITLEPGVYIPGQFGIRIENMVQLSDHGCLPLNTLSTDLIRL